MASKRRNMFHKNKTQETTKKPILWICLLKIVKTWSDLTLAIMKCSELVPGLKQLSFILALVDLNLRRVQAATLISVTNPKDGRPRSDTFSPTRHTFERLHSARPRLRPLPRLTEAGHSDSSGGSGTGRSISRQDKFEIRCTPLNKLCEANERARIADLSADDKYAADVSNSTLNECSSLAGIRERMMTQKYAIGLYRRRAAEACDKCGQYIDFQSAHSPLSSMFTDRGHILRR
ncbi:hypothetical protein AAG570_001427 [Ranatra chinensis]|uniref:Uncharacterized protein n=1 Tax=Ranatra chinensis TaxID=642074 RepID=A0ABD0YC47_9HEMI